MEGMAPAPEPTGCSAPQRVAKVSGEQVQVLLAKLAVVLPCLPTLPLQELLAAEHHTEGEAGGKHVLQEASIIGHLTRIGALGPRTAVAIELAAGTARLSDRLQRVTTGQIDHILVDRQEFKPVASRDRTMRVRVAKQERPSAVERVVCDIASFDIGGYARPAACCGQVQSDGAEGGGCCLLCMSKHLCGPACDLAVGALGRVPPPERPPCCLATCCHYLCTWETFVGQMFWLELGLTKEDFVAAVATSQWHSLRKLSPGDDGSVGPGAGPATEWLPDLCTVARTAAAKLHAAAVPPPAVQSDEFERTFAKEAKAELGRQVKELLDYGRAAELQALGYEVQLVRFTTRSLEDRLLVARLK